MHILYVVPYVPNLIRTRPYNLIRHLSRRGHRLTVLTLYSSAAERADMAALEAEGVTVIGLPLSRARSMANSLLALPTLEPLQATFCRHPGLESRLYRLLFAGGNAQPIDIVHVEHLRGAHYALQASALPEGDRPTPPVVWDSVDSISHLFRQAAAHSESRLGRWMTRLELSRTERYEGWLAWQFDAVLATSKVDVDALAELASAYRPERPPLHVLPNGVDLEYFQPDPAVTRDEATLVLSGKMSYHANVTMAVFLVREVMPLVWARRSDVGVVIVGKDPAPEVMALAKQPGVTVTGSVPDVRPYLQRATMAVAPIVYGAGIQNKVLEAMACSTPVVTTRQAVAALEVRDGSDLLVGDDAPGVAEAILSLLDDPRRRHAVGAAGRAYVLAHHDWAAIAERLESLYASVLRTHSPLPRSWRAPAPA